MGARHNWLNPLQHHEYIIQCDTGLLQARLRKGAELVSLRLGAGLAHATRTAGFADMIERALMDDAGPQLEGREESEGDPDYHSLASPSKGRPPWVVHNGHLPCLWILNILGMGRNNCHIDVSS